MEKDITVIGAGPGGYTFALEASKFNRKVTLIDKSNLGGTCLNIGCMPTKSLLHSAKEIDEVRNAMNKNHIDLKDFSINYEKIIDDSREAIKKLENGIAFLMKKANIEVIQGEASFLSDNKLIVKQADGTTQEFTSNDIVIATGSFSRELPNIKINGKNIHTSKTLLLNRTKPESILIIGSGSIGLEFASFLNSVGTKVTVVEMAPNIMPACDTTISNTLKRYMQAKGVTFYTSATISDFNEANGKITAKITDKNGKEIDFEGDSCLVAIGVIPNTKGLNLENTKVELTDRGFIKVDKNLATTSPNIYAIGDVIGLPTLAHVAMQEAKILARKVCNVPCEYSKNIIPLCTYTSLQVACVGISEDYAKQNNIPYKSARFPFSANGKAVVSEEDAGLVKIIYDPETLKILGCHIANSEATELIGEIALAMNNNLTLKDIAKTIHAHPTLLEAIASASESVL